jgi:hypothetical protein
MDSIPGLKANTNHVNLRYAQVFVFDNQITNSYHK